MNNREAAYKHFMQHEIRIGSSYSDVFYAGFDAAIASQAQQTESQWISVDKYEPKDGDVVYVHHKTVKEVDMAVCEANQHYTRFTSKKFGSEPISYYTHVAHVCMPLPPAPEGEKP